MDVLALHRSSSELSRTGGVSVVVLAVLHDTELDNAAPPESHGWDPVSSLVSGGSGSSRPRSGSVGR
jgi:hypothetical protein